MDDRPLVKIENLEAKLDGEVVFKEVSFAIEPEHFVSIKGPSGCGKTTLLLTICGLLAPSKGKIYLGDKLANSPAVIIPPHLRKMNLLFQELALWPHMTGWEQLKFVWESTKKGDFAEVSDYICWEIGLDIDLLFRYPHQLSRGQQQRLAIARTFVSQPELVLLDEPLTALDQELRSRFVNCLKKVRLKKQMAVVMVSHDLMTDSIEYDQELIFEDFSFIQKK